MGVEGTAVRSYVEIARNISNLTPLPGSRLGEEIAVAARAIERDAIDGFHHPKFLFFKAYTSPMSEWQAENAIYPAQREVPIATAEFLTDAGTRRVLDLHQGPQQWGSDWERGPLPVIAGTLDEAIATARAVPDLIPNYYWADMGTRRRYPAIAVTEPFQGVFLLGHVIGRPSGAPTHALTGKTISPDSVYGASMIVDRLTSRDSALRALVISDGYPQRSVVKFSDAGQSHTAQQRWRTDSAS